MAATKDDVISAVEENDVKFIWLWFTDIVGVLKGVEITKGELEDALDRGMGFDGARLTGIRISRRAIWLECQILPLSR